MTRSARKMIQLESGVSEAGFKDMIERGGKILVVCTESASPVRGNFQGGWKFYAQNPDTGKWAALNLFRARRGVFPPRILKTVNGVCAFLKDLGYPTGVIPYGVGSGVETDKDGNIRFISSVELD